MAEVDDGPKLVSIALDNLETDAAAERESPEHAAVKNSSTLLAQNETISKREMKRRLKAAKWAENKAERRAYEREKRKLKRKTSGPTERVSRKVLKATTMANSSCKVSVVIDLSFDEYMGDKDLSKCIKQVHRSYSINRRAANPVQLYVTSLDGRSLKEIGKNQGYRNWDINLSEKHYSEVFDATRTVYLTAESENVIRELEADKVYIIGGLVDHNAQKGLCHRLAQERRIAHGRLPLDEHIDMKTRKVLTIDHVFNILVNVSNGQPWKETFLQVLPARKGAVERSSAEEDEVPEEDENSQSLSL